MNPLPYEIGISIDSILKVLVFPAPFGPSKPMIDPFLTAKVLS